MELDLTMTAQASDPDILLAAESAAAEMGRALVALEEAEAAAYQSDAGPGTFFPKFDKEKKEGGPGIGEKVMKAIEIAWDALVEAITKLIGAIKSAVTHFSTAVWMQVGAENERAIQYRLRKIQPARTGMWPKSGGVRDVGGAVHKVLRDLKTAASLPRPSLDNLPKISYSEERDKFAAICLEGPEKRFLTYGNFQLAYQYASEALEALRDLAAGATAARDFAKKMKAAPKGQFPPEYQRVALAAAGRMRTVITAGTHAIGGVLGASASIIRHCMMGKVREAHEPLMDDAYEVLTEAGLA